MTNDSDPFALGGRQNDDADAELHQKIAEYWRIANAYEAKAEHTDDDTNRLVELVIPLEKWIELYIPKTLAGVLASLKFYREVDNWEFSADAGIEGLRGLVERGEIAELTRRPLPE